MENDLASTAVKKEKKQGQAWRDREIVHKENEERDYETDPGREKIH